MPELPEVETVRRGLEPVLVGQTIGEVKYSSAPLRYPFPPDFALQLRGKKIEAVGRRAKYLLLDLEGGLVLLSHLGMSGSFRIETEDDQKNSWPLYLWSIEKFSTRSCDHYAQERR